MIIAWFCAHGPFAVKNFFFNLMKLLLSHNFHAHFQVRRNDAVPDRKVILLLYKKLYQQMIEFEKKKDINLSKFAFDIKETITSMDGVPSKPSRNCVKYGSCFLKAKKKKKKKKNEHISLLKSFKIRFLYFLIKPCTNR